MAKSKVESIEPIAIIDFSSDKIISDFLNAQSKNTRATYNTYIKRVLEFGNYKNGSELLRDHKTWKQKLFSFKQWLLDKGYSPYYAQSCCAMVMGFFRFYDKPIMLHRSESKKLRVRTRITEDYNFTNEDLYKCWLCANVKDRYVIAVGKSIGLRAEDFAKITYGQLRALDLNGELPIYLGEIETSKEGVKAHCFLDYDAVQSIKDLLEFYQGKPDNARVWSGRSDDLSKVLQRAVIKAKIDTKGKRVRFHCLRKFLCDRLSMYMSESQWKMIVGKAISEGAYISGLQLREAFKNAMHSIRFNGDVTRKRVSELEQRLAEKDALIKQLQTELAKYKAQVGDINATLSRVIETLETHGIAFVSKPKETTDKP